MKRMNPLFINPRTSIPTWHRQICWSKAPKTPSTRIVKRKNPRYRRGFLYDSPKHRSTRTESPHTGSDGLEPRNQRLRSRADSGGNIVHLHGHLPGHHQGSACGCHKEVAGGAFIRNTRRATNEARIPRRTRYQPSRQIREGP